MRQFGLRFLALWSILIVTFLVSCDGTSQQTTLITSYPRQVQSTEPKLIYPDNASPANETRFFSAFVEIEVNQVEKSVNEVTDLANVYGGRVTNSILWQEDGDFFASVTLSVPAHRFEQVLNDLLEFGKVSSQRIVESTSAARLEQYNAQITVQFQPKKSFISLEKLSAASGRVQHTYTRALSLLAQVVTSLFDLVIWFAVVAGPFILIGLGLLMLLRRPHKG